jgi:hypothetical protein
MQTLARRVATVMQECKMEISPEEYVSKFSPALSNVVYQWATGAKFVEVTFCLYRLLFLGFLTNNQTDLQVDVGFRRTHYTRHAAARRSAETANASFKGYRQ